MAQPKAEVQCRMCGSTLESKTETCRVIVGIRDNGPEAPMQWIVRPYCVTCAESYYHRAVYGGV